MAQTTKVFGQSVLRKEDDRFLTGRGNFVADMLPPGTVFAKFVRSPYAHARIRSINTAKARRLPGVLDVLTSQDMKDQVGDIITAWAIPNANLKTPAYPPLAREVVRYAGEAVAVVVAESPFIAENARDLVEVEYDPLPVVTDVETATKPGRAPLHGDAPDNVAFKWILAGGGGRQGLPGSRRRREPTVREPAPATDRDGAAGRDCAVRTGHAGAHSPRHFAKSVRPPPRPLDRAEISGTPDSRHRPGRRRGIRQQDPRLPLGGDRVPSRDATRAAREVGRRPDGELRRDDPRTRPRAIRRPGRQEGRDDPRDPGSGPREHGRVPVDRGAGYPDDPLRLHGRRMLRDPGRTRRGDRGLHEHDARRRISRRGSTGGAVPPRANGRHPRAEAEERSRRHPAEELHSRGQVTVCDRDGPHVR